MAQAKNLSQSLGSALEKASTTSESDSQTHDSHSGHSAAISNALVSLLTTVIIVPLTRRVRISPVLGFLAEGIALGPNYMAQILYARTTSVACLTL